MLNLVSHKIGVPEIEAELKALKQDYDERQVGFTLECVKNVGYQFKPTRLLLRLWQPCLPVGRDLYHAPR